MESKQEKKASPGRPANTAMPDSFPSRLCDLEVGSSEAKVSRLPLAEATTAARSAMKDSLTSTIRKAAARAKSRTGHEFTVETGDFTTVNDHVVICATVTRVS